MSHTTVRLAWVTGNGDFPLMRSSLVAVVVGNRIKGSALQRNKPYVITIYHRNHQHEQEKNEGNIEGKIRSILIEYFNPCCFNYGVLRA